MRPFTLSPRASSIVLVTGAPATAQDTRLLAGVGPGIQMVAGVGPGIQ